MTQDGSTEFETAMQNLMLTFVWCVLMPGMISSSSLSFCSSIYLILLPFSHAHVYHCVEHVLSLTPCAHNSAKHVE